MISIIILALVIIIILLQVLVLMRLKEWKGKQNSFYTDYRNGKFVLRVFKSEHEFQALTDVRLPQILDRGRLSIYFDWVLIELDTWKK